MAEFEMTVTNAVREGLDLTLRQAALLLLCRGGAPDEDRTISAHAAGLKSSRPAVTRSLDRLETHGLGTRRRLADRRVVCFDLNRQGARLRAWLLEGMKPDATDARLRLRQRSAKRALLDPITPTP